MKVKERVRRYWKLSEERKAGEEKGGMDEIAEIDGGDQRREGLL